MKTETHMDYLLQKLAKFNDLVDMREQENETSAGENKKKSGSRKGSTQGGGLFGAAGAEMFFRRSGETRPGILGISHPSDGHPQEELTPDFGWFRSLAFNNPTWTLYWPELII